ncbi:MAG: hypothetical protein OER88_11650 [Planctomycetota bacterium]|nr:hypothetical protein [Planctomycetota bacterium]
MRGQVVFFLAAIAALGAVGHTADQPADSVEDVVARQGKKIESLEAEIKKMRKTQRSAQASALGEDIDGYLAASADETERVEPQGSKGGGFFSRTKVGGYFSLEFRDDGDSANSEFDQHRLVIKLQSEIIDGIGFETEIEIEGGGADVDFLSDNEVLVEYAELSFEIVEDKLVFKVGLILVPWGRFNQFHDDPLNDLTDRPLVSRRVAAVAFDQAGIGAEGTFEFGDGWFLDYDVALVQGFGDGFSTNGGVRGARQSFREDNNNNKAVFGRFVVSPPTNLVDVLDVGVSFVYGKHDDAGHLAHYGYAFDVFVKRGPFEFTAEFMSLRIEQPAGAAVSEPRRMYGWYVEVAYHIFPAGWRGKHKLFTDESTFTFVVRIEDIDLNSNTDGTTFRDDLMQVTIGINFRPVERTVFKVSYTFVDSDEVGFASGSADKVIVSWATYF